MAVVAYQVQQDCVTPRLRVELPQPGQASGILLSPLRVGNAPIFSLNLMKSLILFLSAVVARAATPPSLDDLAGVPQLVRSCFLSNINRTSCNSPGTSEQECGDRGCCWDSSESGRPWCFYPQARPDNGTAGIALRYVGSQSAPAAASLRIAAHSSVTGDAVVGVSCISAPPLAQECDYDYNGPVAAYGWPFGLAVAGEMPAEELSFQWFPYQVLRTGSTVSGDVVSSALRLSGSTDTVLLEVNITFGTSRAGAVDAVFAVPMHIARFPGVWDWGRPTASSDPSHYAVSIDDGGGSSAAIAVSRDTSSGAEAATGIWLTPQSNASVTWALRNVSAPGLRSGVAAWLNVTWGTVPPIGTSASFSLVLSMGVNATADARAAAAAFPARWVDAHNDWERVWRGAFDGGGGGVFSGSLPVLPWPASHAAASTMQGDAAPPPLSRAYYGGILSMLMLLRRVAPGSAVNVGWQLPTAAPVWAVTTTYLWDSSMVATTMALLEPAGWLSMIGQMLSIGTHSHYAVDYLSGTGVGPWYAFNDVSTFSLLDRYGQASAVRCSVSRRLEGARINTTTKTSASATNCDGSPTGDLAFYNSTLNGVRVIEWLDRSATYYTYRPSYSGLADYGDTSNLLECVPTYMHAVPALNAANIYMLNRTADIWRALGNESRAAALIANATLMLNSVLQLYVADEGVWACEYPNGTKVPVRHAVDFITIADSIAWALQNDTRAAMRNFFVTELQTVSTGGASPQLGAVWMRALSLRDAAASASDRADHGPLGAYDGWPARAAVALSELGFHDEGVAFLSAAAASALDEGPFGQAHRLLLGDVPVKAGGPGGQDALESVGGAFADAALLLLSRE